MAAMQARAESASVRAKIARQAQDETANDDGMRERSADRALRVIVAWVVSARPEVGVLRLRAVRQGVFGVGWRLDGRGHAGWD